MNKEPLNVYGRQTVRTMLIDFARHENLQLVMHEDGDRLYLLFHNIFDGIMNARSKEFMISWPKCTNAWATVNTVIKYVKEWKEKYDCDSESKRHLELGRAFAEGFEAGFCKELKNCAAEYCRKDAEMTYKLYSEYLAEKASKKPPEIKNVVFNDPATIVMWADGTKTVVKCQDDDWYDPEKGLAMAIAKKVMGNEGNYYDIFKHWLKKYKKPAAVQEFEFTFEPSTFKFNSDILSNLALGKGKLTIDKKKEDKE